MRKVEIMKQKAYKYYSMGLNSKEISSILKISYRTVQNYMSSGKWKQKRQLPNIKLVALELYETGYTYEQIAKKINMSRASVYLYLKDTRKFKEKQAAKQVIKNRV